MSGTIVTSLLSVRMVKLLYFVSQRDFNPVYSATEWNHAYVDMSKPYFVRLTAAGVNRLSSRRTMK